MLQIQKHKKTPIWLLATPRTGSYYLSYCLNLSGLNPEIQEYWNGSIYPNYEGFPCNNKVHPLQLREKDKTLNDVTEVLPNVKFVLLRRRDVIAQAVSRYIAQETGIWSVRNEKNKFDFQSSIRIPLSKDGILEMYQKCQDDEQYWLEQDVDKIETFYEDFIGNKQEIQRLFSCLGISYSLEDDFDSKIPLRKQRDLRPEYGRFYNYLEDLVG